MDNYSSRICTKCYSVQEPHSRFCDNCGKAFTATAATDGNVSMITRTFLKQQVSQTRPLFWLGIIIVGMLTVFGFAQAGIFRSAPPSPVGIAEQKPTNDLQQGYKQINEEAAAQPPSDALNLNESVFEMREGATSSPQAVVKKRSASLYKKPIIDAGTKPIIETAAVAPSDTAVVTPASTMEPPQAKTSDNDSSPRKVMRGPMGGCYYISASGSKRYVDRALCN